MLLVGATRYFARGMELGFYREPADRIFIITTVNPISARLAEFLLTRKSLFIIKSAKVLTGTVNVCRGMWRFDCRGTDSEG
jgi:hypothetical protein